MLARQQRLWYARDFVSGIVDHVQQHRCRFARRFDEAEVCAEGGRLCCNDKTLDCPMNCEKGTAGMNCPKVPVAVVLYVRLEATVVTLGIAVGERLLVTVDSGRISSTPVAAVASDPMPK